MASGGLLELETEGASAKQLATITVWTRPVRSSATWTKPDHRTGTGRIPEGRGGTGGAKAPLSRTHKETWTSDSDQ